MSKTTSSVQKSEPWAPAQPALKDLIGKAQGMYESGGFNVQPYGGPRVAGLSGDTRAALGAMSGGSPVTGVAQNAYSAMLQADPYRNMDQIRQNVTEQTKAALASTFGGAMDGGLAQQGYADAIGGALANVEYGAYNQDQNRRAQLLGMAPTIQGLGYQDANMQLQAGQIQDAQKQKQLAAQMLKYYETQNAPMEGLTKYSAMLQGLGGMGGTQYGSQTRPWSLGETGSALSGLGSLLMFSDRRLKRNIRKIGRTSGGNNVYSFTYIWGEPSIGVMADEVPEAIAGTVGGYAVVDYARVK